MNNLLEHVEAYLCKLLEQPPYIHIPVLGILGLTVFTLFFYGIGFLAYLAFVNWWTAVPFWIIVCGYLVGKIMKGDL
jgi:hypothetical protein